MAQGIVIKITLDTRDIARAAQEIQSKLKGALDGGGAGFKSLKSSTDSATLGINTMRTAVTGLTAAFAALGGIAVLRDIASRAVDAAIAIDRQINSLRALTGSAAAAQQRFQELFQIAQKTPGLTTSLATALDTQLRIFNVAEQTINRLLPVIGRLNAISPLGDPRQFVNNLTQLISQNFERQDLKELVGASPIAGNLIKEIFNVDNPTNAEAIRKSAQKLGITTVERLSDELIKAAENNQALQSVVESIGGKFDKIKDRLTVALAPVGNEIARTLLPIFDDLVRQVEKYGESAARVFQENRGDIIAAAKEITSLGVEIAKLIGSFTASPQVREFFRLLGTDAARVRDILDSGAGSGERAKRLFGFSKGPNELAAEQEAASRLSTGETVGEFELRLQQDAKGILTRPQAGGTGTGTGTGNNARNATNAQARALRDAQLALVKQLAEDSLKIEQEANKRGVDDLKDAYDRNKITLQDYYQFKQNLEVASLEHKLRSLDQEAAAITKNLAAAKGAEKIRDQAKLNDVLTQEELIRGKILDVIVSTGRESQKNTQLQALTLEQVAALQVPVIDPAVVERERRITDLRRQASEFGVAELELRRQEVQIQNAVNQGALTEAEGREAILATQRQFRDVMLEALKAQEALTTDPEGLAQLKLQAEQIRSLGVEFSNAQRFARGFGSQIETVGDAFDRFGQNVSRALTNVKDLFGGLKNAVLNFFNDLLGRSLQNVLRQVLAPIAGIAGIAGGGAAAAGGIGGIFRTPSTFPAQIAQAFGGAGGGIGVPASVTQTQQIEQVFNDIAAPATRPRTVTGAIGSAAVGSGFSLSGIFGSLASAAPLLGLGLGAGLGGQSKTGQVLGAAGAGAVGLGVSFGASVFGAGGGIAQAALAALGPAALIGVPLLIGSILLGKAAQRRKDEEASGQFLTQALTAIDQLAAGVGSGQIDGSQARSIFDSQILATFKRQIGALKTASVRDSRLHNQVRDLENTYQARIPPLIAEQQRKAADAARLAADSARFSAIDSRLIPQFASGGFVSGIDRGRDSVLTMLTPGELVLNRGQQAGVMRQAGPDVFSRAGVPAVNTSGRYADGGYARTASSSGSGGTVVIDRLFVSVDAEGIAITGMSGRNGEQVVVNHIENVRLRKGGR